MAFCCGHDVTVCVELPMYIYIVYINEKAIEIGVNNVLITNDLNIPRLFLSYLSTLKTCSHSLCVNILMLVLHCTRPLTDDGGCV